MAYQSQKDSYNRNDFRGFAYQLMCQFLVVRNHMGNVDVTCELVGEYILSDLISASLLDKSCMLKMAMLYL